MDRELFKLERRCFIQHGTFHDEILPQVYVSEEPMISGSLGTAQLGLAQLGAYQLLDTPASTPPSGPGSVVNIEPSTLEILVLPNVYEMMGQWKVF